MISKIITRLRPQHEPGANKTEGGGTTSAARVKRNVEYHKGKGGDRHYEDVRGGTPWKAQEWQQK